MGEAGVSEEIFVSLDVVPSSEGGGWRSQTTEDLLLCQGQLTSSDLIPCLAWNSVLKSKGLKDPSGKPALIWVRTGLCSPKGDIVSALGSWVDNMSEIAASDPWILPFGVLQLSNRYGPLLLADVLCPSSVSITSVEDSVLEGRVSGMCDGSGLASCNSGAVSCCCP